MSPGDRVVLLDTVPWPERRGLTATVVAPPTDGSYPQPAEREVLVKVDDDPLLGVHSWWSCALDKKHLARIRDHLRFPAGRPRGSCGETP